MFCRPISFRSCGQPVPCSRAALSTFFRTIARFQWDCCSTRYRVCVRIRKYNRFRPTFRSRRALPRSMPRMRFSSSEAL
ncbi:hypothetical protein DQ04_00381180 [Trypanosoma grayi]|uniref:hypothetical protein n=1 Tax=Trypanosoma grayi TaxID=71804 RepID=UPI0004F43440|nr:hypothetical protein DQ04_00381180 [Trypanosoma grayi]KEG14613.1 hypothetical protein DQ04_00381180 [Trypanosoma grayi]